MLDNWCPAHFCFAFIVVIVYGCTVLILAEQLLSIKLLAGMAGKKYVVDSLMMRNFGSRARFRFPLFVKKTSSSPIRSGSVNAEQCKSSAHV